MTFVVLIIIAIIILVLKTPFIKRKPELLIDPKYYKYSLGPNNKNVTYTYINEHDILTEIKVRKKQVEFICAAEDTVEGDGLIQTNDIRCY